MEDEIHEVSIEEVGEQLSEEKEEEMTFTVDELEVAIDKIDRALYRMESSGLTDSYCYPRLYSFQVKLKKLLKKRLRIDSDAI